MRTALLKTCDASQVFIQKKRKKALNFRLDERNTGNNVQNPNVNPPILVKFKDSQTDKKCSFFRIYFLGLI